METYMFDWWRWSRQPLARKSLRIFRFCVMLWKDEREPTIKYCLGRQVDLVQKFITIQSFGHSWSWANGIRVEYFHVITTLELVLEVQKFMRKFSESEQFQGRICFMSMFDDIIWRNKDNETECIANSTHVSLFFKRCPEGRSSFLGLGSETKWYSTGKERPGRKWDRVAELTTTKFGESGHPVFRAASPFSRGMLKSKGGVSVHFCADGDNIETVFRAIICVNQLSIYGAVSDLCAAYSSCQTRTGRLVVAEQSNPFFAPANLIMTPTPSIEIPAQENLLQKHKERVEKLPQPDQLIKICTDAGFLNTVEVGQHFMTKHTDEFSQFAEPVTCREYTLPRDDKLTDPKVEFKGTPKLDPYPTSYLQCIHGVEIRIESVNKDNSHSWVRISHGLNKLVTDLIDWEYDDDEQETSTTKTEIFAFASRSKAKAIPSGLSTACSPSKTVPILERTWIDIEPGPQFDQAYPVAKRINTLLRHGELHREEDGAIEFWRLKDDLQNKFECWSDDVWKSKMARGGGNKKIFQVHLSHWMCVNLHSITNSGLIPGGQNSSRDRQTIFFTAVNPMHKNHQDQIELDLTKPRLASYKPKWKVHQDTVYWVNIQLAQRKGLKFHQTRSNAVILHDTLPAYCISKAIVMKSEEIMRQKVYV